MNTYVPIFQALDARGDRKVRTDTHTHMRDTHTRDNHSNDNKIIRSAEAHACYKHVTESNGEYTKHCMRSRNQLKMAAPAEVSKKRSILRIRKF